MKILCLADLHYRRPWYDWFIRESLNFDLTCIAGDLLYDPATFRVQSTLPDWDGGRTPSLALQTEHVRVLLQSAADEGRLGRIAVCSGNHDPLYLWGRERGIGSLPPAVFINDNSTANFDGPEPLTVTTLSHELRGERFTDSWREAAQKVVGKWMVLCHIGPIGTRVFPGGRAEQPVRECIGTNPPSILICGHIHRAPFCDGGAWAERVGKTLVLNPGSQEYDVKPAEFPPYIVVDTDAGQVRWDHCEVNPSHPQALNL
jgi:Icc-related predicted phosphoesterase